MIPISAAIQKHAIGKYPIANQRQQRPVPIQQDTALPFGLPFDQIPLLNANYLAELPKHISENCTPQERNCFLARYQHLEDSTLSN